MKYRVQLSARAERDIEDVLVWLCAQGAETAARRWHERLLRAVDTLQEQPGRCPLAAEAEELGIELRELLLGRRRGIYRILFVVQSHTVHIVHVWHSAREALRPDDL